MWRENEILNIPTDNYVAEAQGWERRIAGANCFRFFSEAPALAVMPRRSPGHPIFPAETGSILRGLRENHSNGSPGRATRAPGDDGGGSFLEGRALLYLGPPLSRGMTLKGAGTLAAGWPGQARPW